MEALAYFTFGGNNLTRVRKRAITIDFDSTPYSTALRPRRYDRIDVAVYGLLHCDLNKMA